MAICGYSIDMWIRTSDALWWPARPYLNESGVWKKVRVSLKDSIDWRTEGYNVGAVDDIMRTPFHLNLIGYGATGTIEWYRISNPATFNINTNNVAVTVDGVASNSMASGFAEGIVSAISNPSGDRPRVTFTAPGSGTGSRMYCFWAKDTVAPFDAENQFCIVRVSW